MGEKGREFELIIRLEYPFDKNEEERKEKRSENVNRKIEIEKENSTELEKTRLSVYMMQ